MTPGERALRTSAAVVRLDRAVYRLTGSTPLAYLHDVLAQDVSALGPGRGALAVALDPNGRVSAEMRVLPVNGAVLIDGEQASSEGIEERIGRHAALAGCELEGLTETFAVAAVRGPAAGDALEPRFEVPGPAEAAFVTAGNVLVARVTWGVAGFDFIGAAADVADAVATLDVVEAADEELEALRIAAGRPRFGVEVDSAMLVNETPYVTHALALDKGCYPGQESVARVHNLGSIRRVLRGLRSTGEMRAGADVVYDAVVVGTVRSAANLSEGGSAAIAYLKSEVAPGGIVDTGDVTASVVALE